jgi:hypothetical protein
VPAAYHVGLALLSLVAYGVSFCLCNCNPPHASELPFACLFLLSLSLFATSLGCQASGLQARCLQSFWPPERECDRHIHRYTQTSFATLTLLFLAQLLREKLLNPPPCSAVCAAPQIPTRRCKDAHVWHMHCLPLQIHTLALQMHPSLMCWVGWE